MKSIFLGSEESNHFFVLNYWNCDTTNQQFLIPIDQSERIQLIKLTDDDLLVLTRLKFSRSFSLSGIQERLLRFQGPAISISSFISKFLTPYLSFEEEEEILFLQGVAEDVSVSYLIIDFDDDR